MSKLTTFNRGRKKGSRDKKKRIQRAVVKGMTFGAILGGANAVTQEGIKYGWKRLNKQQYVKPSLGKLGGNIAAGVVLGALGEGIANGLLEKYKQSKYYSKTNNKINKFVDNDSSYSNNDLVTFKDKVKVRSFQRKGKLVRSYVRKGKDKRNIAIGSGIIATGLLIALSRSNKLKVALDVISRNTKNKFRKLPNIVAKDLKQVNNNAEKLNLVRNKKAVTETTNTVFFVDDLTNKETYLFKQSKIIPGFKVTTSSGFGTYTHGNEQAAEALASEIGTKFGISIQTTKIVPANTMFDGKQAGLPGSLHGVAAGKSVNEVFPDRIFNVQHLRYKPSNKQIVDDLFMQKDISEISALDTFLGNEDRNPNNLFYDATSKKFTAIDHGRLFTFPYNYNKLKKAIFSEYSRMTPDQKVNLRTYNKKLKQLTSTYSPEQLSQKYDNYFLEALSGSDKSVYDQALKSRQRRIKNMFYSHEQSTKLSKDIDRLLGE